MLLKYIHLVFSGKQPRGKTRDKNTASRHKVTLLSLLMFVSIVTTLPILQPTNVAAATTVASKSQSDFTWRTQSLLYYRAIAYCMANSALQDSDNGFANNTNRISRTNAQSGKWFTTGGAHAGQLFTTSTTTGVYMRDATSGDAMDVGSDGKVGCDNPALISSALSLWGLDAVELLCNSGFRRADMGNNQTIPTCIDGKTDFERDNGGKDNTVAKFTAYIRDKIYGGKEPELTSAEWYIYYRHSLSKSCIVGIDTKAPGATVYDSSNNRGYNDVKWIDSTDPKLIKIGSYIGDWQKSENVALRTGPASAYNSYEKNCAEVVTLMNGYANDYLVWAKLAGTDAALSASVKGQGGVTTSSNKTACAIDGVGWIICPVMNFMAQIVDGSYGIVAGLLKTPALNVNTASPENGTYRAWAIMRSFANVAFVIAFLLIIFSQLTSIGIGNYGIKKMLPRLVIAAILVNLSYFICAIGVDLSNILGGSMKQLFEGVSGQLAAPVFADNFKTGDGWMGIVGFLLAGSLGTTALLYAGLSVLLPGLIAALVAIVTVFLVLTLRQALIIILIVISPLAFVAFLLPNTEDLFTKWRKLFTTLLLMFPIIALIFGASTLASKIIMASEATFFVQVMGALVAIIPLFITPIVMKTAGGVLNRFGGAINNPNKGPFDRMRKGSDNIRKREVNRLNNRAMNGSGKFSPRRAFLRRNAKVESIDQNQARELNRAKTGYIAEEAQNNSAFLGKMTAGGGAGAEGRALGAAANISAKLEAEEVTAASAIIKSLNLSQSEARDLANGGAVNRTTAGVTKTVANSADDLSLRIAARQQVVGSNDVKGINDLIDSSAGWGEKDRVSLSDTLSSASSRPSYIGQGALAKMRSGAATGPMKMMRAEEMIEAAIRDNVYSAAKIAAADKDELNVVANVAVASAAISTPEKQRLVNNATTALTDPELSRTITKNLENVRHVQTNTSPAPLA